MHHLFIDEIARALRVSLYTEQNQSLAPFVHGEVVPLAVSIINRIPNVSAGQLWTPRDLSTATIRVGLGKSLQLPVAGTFTLDFEGDETTPLAYNVSASAMAAALNLLPSIIAAGGVTVTQPGTGYYFVSFVEEGAQAVLVGDASNLAPLSIIDPQTLIAGNVDQRAIQTIRIVQNPGAFTTLATELEEADAVVDVLTVGGDGENHKVRLRITPDPYAGKFTFRVQASETGFLDWQISGPDLQAAIEALESVGAGNVTVEEEAGSSWVIMFINELADLDMGDIDADGSALRSYLGKSGKLDLRTAGVELLLSNSSTPVDVILEVEAIYADAGGAPYKALQYEGKLRDAIIDPSSTVPPPNLYEGFDLIVPVPAAPDSPGVPGNVAYDEDWEYRYVGDGVTHEWRRKALVIWTP